MSLSKLDKMKQRANSLISTGDWAEARAQLEKLCKKFPGDFDSWYLLGAVCGQTDDIENALLASKKAVVLQPNNAGALYNYGMALARTGDNQGAANVFKKALVYNPDNAATLRNLGNTLKDSGQCEEAIPCLERAIKLEPNKAEAFFSLGCIYIELAKPQQAVEYLKQAGELNAEYKTKADYFIAAVTEHKEMDERGNIHVRILHDEHSEIFDQHLTKGLKYNIPKILFDLYRQHNPGGNNAAIDILDLGCGTGLCGIEFREIAGKITGVDLSPGMIARARLTKAYDNLITDDIMHYLNTSNDTFDLILSADVFIYVGALDNMLPACADALNDNGLMAFSVETIAGDTYRLRGSGRFAHSDHYINTLADDAGFALVHDEDVVIRKEFNHDITGKVYLLQKK